MVTLVKILITFCITAFCTSCNMSIAGIKGEGEVVRKEKTIKGNFDTIKSSKGLDVILTPNQNGKVIIEANENLHKHIEVFVEDNILHITSNKNIYSADEKNVYVSYDSVSKIYASSGSSITSVENVVQKNLSLSATSGADIKLNITAVTLSTSVTSGALIDLTGKVENHTSKASSGADIRADELLSSISEAKATSGSKIRIYAKNSFIGKASSGGDIIIYGNPENVSKDNSSGGSVRKN